MNKRILTIIGLAVLGAAFTIAQIAPDTDSTVRVQTKPRVLRATVEWNEAGDLVGVTAYLFVVEYNDGAVVGKRQIKSTTISAEKLTTDKPVLANQLNNFATFLKNNWPVEAPVEPPANP